MKAAAVIAAVILSGCSAVVPPRTPSDPVPVDALLYEVNLWTQDSASLHAAATGSNVTWQMGTPPAEHYGAYTTWWCVFDACTFDVVVRPGYWERDVIRHEASHIACVTAWGDGSEECADRLAA